MRIFRLARVIRLVVQFKTLWLLVRGFLACFSTVLYTALIIFLLVYVFTCLGLELKSKNMTFEEGSAAFDIKTQYFKGVGSTTLTLAQFVSFDRAGAIYTPLIMADGWLAYYFFPVMLMVSVALMHMVTAVIVEDAIEQRKSDKEVVQMQREAELRGSIPSSWRSSSRSTRTRTTSSPWRS